MKKTTIWAVMTIIRENLMAIGHCNIVGLLLLLALPAGAQTVLKDQQTRKPIADATVCDGQGYIVGMTDKEGLLPNLKGAEQLVVTHLGYETLKANTSDIGSELLMRPIAYQLGEVVATAPEEPHVIRFRCYYRKYLICDRELGMGLPVNSVRDGICNLYVRTRFSIDPTHVVYTVVRDFGDGNLFAPDIVGKKRSMIGSGLGNLTYADIYRFNEGYIRKEYGNRTEVYKQKKDSLLLKATLVVDSMARTVFVDYSILDHNYKSSIYYQGHDGSRTKLLKGRLIDKNQELYRMKDDGHTSISGLLAYSHINYLMGERDGEKLDVRFIEEFYPVEAEFLSKEQYKEETKHPVLQQEADIDVFKERAKVPALPK